MRALIDQLQEMSARIVRKKLKKAGCREVRQKGSHITVKCPIDKQSVVPNHGSKDLGKGLLKAISKQTGVKL